MEDNCKSGVKLGLINGFLKRELDFGDGGEKYVEEMDYC